MEGFQAAVLNVKMKHLDDWTAKRQARAALYRELLTDTDVQILEDPPESECVYHLFVVYVNDRDRVRAELEKRGVQTAIHYPLPVHLQEAFANLGYGRGSLPATERACERVISMPLFPEMSEDQVRYAASTLKTVVADVTRKAAGGR